MSGETKVSFCNNMLTKYTEIPLHTRVQNIGKTQLYYFNICYYKLHCYCLFICANLINTLYYDIFSKINPRSGLWSCKQESFGSLQAISSNFSMKLSETVY